MKININYDVSHIKTPAAREAARPFIYGKRHFTQAWEHVKELDAAIKANKAGQTALSQTPQRLIQEIVFDVVCHGTLALVEMLPLVNLVAAVAERQYFQQPPVKNKEITDDAQLPHTDAIIPSTDQKVIDDLYEILEATHDILSKNGIKYCLADGSQLGATRHEGIIRWDDDVDAVTLYENKDKILALREEFRKRGLDMHWATSLYDTIHIFKLGTKKNAFLPGFPAIDIDLLMKRGNRYERSGLINHYKYGSQCYTEEEWNRVAPVPFGHLSIPGLTGDDAKNFLTRCYGSRCLTTAIKTHGHADVFIADAKGQELVRIENFKPALHSQHPVSSGE